MPLRTLPGDPTRLDFASRAVQTLYRGAASVPWVPIAGPYHLTISHSHKFIWFRVAKVGTRTILNLFKNRGVRLDAEHPSFLYYPPGRYRDYFKFAFVRNPWDRLVSCWYNKVLETNYFQFQPAQHEAMKDFARFVEFVGSLDVERCDRHLQLQSRLIDLVNVDYLGRMESFDRDLTEVCERIRVDRGEVTPVNVSTGRKPYREYFDAPIRERVSHIYRKDIQTFGYSF